MKDLVGTRVAGRFRITRLLGQGGMASVWVAEQDGEPREVALKIMSESLTADPRFVKRFAREATAAARVQHANTVRIFDHGSSGHMSYIAMELLQGTDLQGVLDHGGPMSQRRAAWIIAEVCDALVTAHDLGVVHRDLKPENVMVIPSAAGERVKVLDFGIAKMLFEEGTAEDPPDSDEQPTALTRAGTQLGTPAYMSPEQCQLLELDRRSDIYTCGILLYQTMTGGVPFEGDTPLHTASLHIHDVLVPPSTYAPHLDKRLEAIIVRALAKKPADRQQSATELGNALRDLLPSLPDAPARLGGPPSRRSNPGRSVPPPAAGAAPPETPKLAPRASAPKPAAGAPARTSSPGPLPMFGGPRPTHSDARRAALAGGTTDDDDQDEDDVRTLMRDPTEFEVASTLEDESAKVDPTSGATPPVAGGADVLLQISANRRGTQILDMSAPVASPSAPRAMLVRNDGEVLTAVTGTSVPSAAARRDRAAPNGLAAMLLGFLAGLLLIGAGLVVYMLTR